MLKLTIKPIKDFYAIVAIATMMFSAACLTNDDSLLQLFASGVVVACCCAYTIVKNRLTVRTIVNGATLWLASIYFLIELYGLLFLRMDTFNGDLYLFKAIRIICIAGMLYSLRSSGRAINVMINGSKVGIVFSAAYMYSTGMFSKSAILGAELGARIGGELTGNVNITASIFSMMLLPVFYSVLEKRRKDLSGIICCVIAVAVILLSGSKKGLIAIVWAILLIWATNRSAVKYLIVPLLVLGGIYAIQNVPWLYNILGSRLQDMFATFGIGEAATAYQSTANRYNFIAKGLQSFLKVPIFGGGINYFKYINNAYAHSHCNYIEVLNSFGLFGFMIFYAFPVAVLFKVKAQLKDKEQQTNRLTIFVIMYLLLIFVLDWTMLSFAESGITYIPAILAFLHVKDCTWRLKPTNLKKNTNTEREIH